MHDAYLFEVKKPSEPKYPGDFYKLRATIPAAETSVRSRKAVVRWSADRGTACLAARAVVCIGSAAACSTRRPIIPPATLPFTYHHRCKKSVHDHRLDALFRLSTPAPDRCR